MADALEILIEAAKKHAIGLSPDDLAILARALSAWRPIAEVSIHSFGEGGTTMRYRCLIQTGNGSVHGGFARWERKAGGRRAVRPFSRLDCEVRFYAYENWRWLRDAVYFMPMPAPRRD